jgi:hypothetical protein
MLVSTDFSTVFQSSLLNFSSLVKNTCSGGRIPDNIDFVRNPQLIDYTQGAFSDSLRYQINANQTFP